MKKIINIVFFLIVSSVFIIGCDKKITGNDTKCTIGIGAGLAEVCEEEDN